MDREEKLRLGLATIATRQYFPQQTHFIKIQKTFASMQTDAATAVLDVLGNYLISLNSAFRRIEDECWMTWETLLPVK